MAPVVNPFKGMTKRHPSAPPRKEISSASIQKGQHYAAGAEIQALAW